MEVLGGAGEEGMCDEDTLRGRAASACQSSAAVMCSASLYVPSYPSPYPRRPVIRAIWESNAATRSWRRIPALQIPSDGLQTLHAAPCTAALLLP